MAKEQERNFLSELVDLPGNILQGVADLPGNIHKGFSAIGSAIDPVGTVRDEARIARSQQQRGASQIQSVTDVITAAARRSGGNDDIAQKFVEDGLAEIGINVPGGADFRPFIQSARRKMLQQAPTAEQIGQAAPTGGAAKGTTASGIEVSATGAKRQGPLDLAFLGPSGKTRNIRVAADKVQETRNKFNAQGFTEVAGLPSAPNLIQEVIDSPDKFRASLAKKLAAGEDLTPDDLEAMAFLEPPKTRDEEFKRSNTLRKEFDAATHVKAFNVVQKSLGDIREATRISTDKDSKSRIASDQALAVSFQKMLDPDSVVRESEYERTGNGAAVLSRIEAFIPKLAKGGIAVSDDDRRSILEMGEALFNISASLHNRAFDRFEDLSKRQKVDPGLIFGTLKRAELIGSKQGASESEAVNAAAGNINRNTLNEADLDNLTVEQLQNL